MYPRAADDLVSGHFLFDSLLGVVVVFLLGLPGSIHQPEVPEVGLEVGGKSSVHDNLGSLQVESLLAVLVVPADPDRRWHNPTERAQEPIDGDEGRHSEGMICNCQLCP